MKDATRKSLQLRAPGLWEFKQKSGLCEYPLQIFRPLNFIPRQKWAWYYNASLYVRQRFKCDFAVTRMFSLWTDNNDRVSVLPTQWHHVHSQSGITFNSIGHHIIRAREEKYSLRQGLTTANTQQLSNITWVKGLHFLLPHTWNSDPRIPCRTSYDQTVQSLTICEPSGFNRNLEFAFVRYFINAFLEKKLS